MGFRRHVTTARTATAHSTARPDRLQISWCPRGNTSLEGFECGRAEQHVCRSDYMAACPSVAVNPLVRRPIGHVTGMPTAPRVAVVSNFYSVGYSRLGGALRDGHLDPSALIAAWQRPGVQRVLHHVVAHFVTRPPAQVAVTCYLLTRE